MPAAALSADEHVVEVLQRRRARWELGQRVDRSAGWIGLVLDAPQQPLDRAADDAREVMLRGMVGGPLHCEEVRRGRIDPRDVAVVGDALLRESPARCAREVADCLLGHSFGGTRFKD